MTRLATSEIKFLREKLDAIAACSKDGVAVYIKRVDNGTPIPGAYYKDGLVSAARYSKQKTLEQVDGFLAWWIKEKEWVPHRPRAPLVLLAELAQEDSDPGGGDGPARGPAGSD